MRNMLKLMIGELRRLITYKILPISLITSVIWIVIFLFISKEEAKNIAPLLIFVDISMMSILLIGASYHFEKQEGTIKTMMILPVSMSEILTAKIISSLILGLESAIITSAALFIIHGVTFNYAVLLLFVLLSGAAHAIIGFFLALNSKDFTSMLGLLMAFMIILGLPSILFTFNIIDVKYDWFMMISPSHTANTLISSAVSGDFEVAKVIVGCVYLVLLSTALLKFAVYPKFKSNAVRG